MRRENDEFSSKVDNELNGPLHILASAAAKYGPDSDFDWETGNFEDFEGPKVA